MEGWPEDIALDTFRGMYADALRANCPMGRACRLGRVIIEAVDPSEFCGEPSGLKLVAECPAERCPIDIVFGVAGKQAIQIAQNAGLISGGSLKDNS